jgi:serine/threonine protein kinase
VEPRILDFGVSKALVGGDASVLALTKTGEILGTPLYMSPEQVQGTKNIDQRSDIYALGVILYQMVSGEIPFKAETFPGLIFEIISGEAKPLSYTAPGLPIELNDVIMTAMALSPNDRFANVERLAQAIRPLGQRDSERAIGRRRGTRLRRSSISDTSTPFKTEVETTTRTPSLLRKHSRVTLAAYLAVALAIVGAATFYALFWRKDTPKSESIQAVEPPQSPKTTRIVSQPLPSAPTESASEIESKTKVSQIGDSPTNRTNVPKDKNEHSRIGDRKKRSRTIAETSEKPFLKAVHERPYREENLPVEKKTGPVSSPASNDFEIDDDQIIDPFAE